MRKIFPFFYLSFFICISAIADEVKIDRFLEVSDGIYRSARPNEEAMDWIKDEHNMKTIINLENDFEVVEQEQEWAEERNIAFYSLPMDGQETPKDWRVNKALELLSDSSKHPRIDGPSVKESFLVFFEFLKKSWLRH